MSNEEKKGVVEKILGQGDTMVCLDSRHPEVDVPVGQRGKDDLRLIMNYQFRGTIDVFDEGIQANLRFGGVAHQCWIPFESVWAVYNPNTGEGALWPEQLPESLRDLLLEDAADSEKNTGPEELPPLKSPQPKPPPKTRKGERPVLRVIKGAKKD